MKKLIFLFILISMATVANAQDNEAFVKKSYVILGTYNSYNKALRKSQLFANKLQIPLNLRNLIFDKETNGLTSTEICGCGEKHGYIPRGRYDDGVYISIEHTSGLTPTSKYSKFVIVATSGEESTVQEEYKKIVAKVKKAEILTYSVYLGCMH